MVSVAQRSGTRALIALLCIAMLLVGMTPTAVPPPARAQDGETPLTVVRVSMNDTHGEFSPGRFQRTAVTMYDTSSPYDNGGAVQMMPFASLVPFTTTTKLPIKVRNMGVFSMGKYLGVLGGDNREKNPEDNPISDVYVAEVDLNTGAPIAWEMKDSLPAIPASNQTQTVFDETFDATEPVAEVRHPAVVAVPDPGNDNAGYVYVIGGQVEPPGLLDQGDQALISSAATHIGRFDNGSLTWNQDPGILLMNPDRPDESYGVQSAMATHYTTPDGTTYVYLLGGMYTRLDEVGNTEPDRDQNNYVFYARVDRDNNGMLVKPSDGTPGWDYLADTDIPVPADAITKDDMGLWDAVVLTNTSFGGDGVLYLIGGQRLLQSVNDPDNTYSNATYRATINDDGTLTWDQEGALPAGALIGSAGIEYGDSVYLTGGKETPKAGGGTDEVILENITGNYFNSNQVLRDDYWISTSPGKGLQRERFGHGMAVVQAQSSRYPSTLAFVYAIGGQSGSMDDPNSSQLIGTDPDDEQSNEGTDTVLFSRIDPEEASEKFYAADGWFYSQPFDVSDPLYEIDNKTAITGISWSTLLTRTQDADMDIMLEYRIDEFDNCLFGGGNEGWQVLTQTNGLQSAPPLQATDLMTTSQIYSYKGSNSSNLRAQDTQGKIGCIQYRAKFTTEDSTQTPMLLNVGLLILSNRLPDLKVADDLSGPVYDEENPDLLENFDVIVRNLNGDSENDVSLTAAADYDDFRFTDAQNRDQFSVDALIYAPGETYVTDMELPLIGDEPVTATMHLYNSIQKNLLQPGDVFPDNEDVKTTWDASWRDPENNNQEMSLVDAIDSIGMSGVYTICIGVDSWITLEDSQPKEPTEENWDEEVAKQWRDHAYVNESDEGNNYHCFYLDMQERETDVWVEASEEPDDQPAEKDPTTEQPRRGTFNIYRSQAVSSSLTVTFSIKGTATLTSTTGTLADYTTDPENTTASITIPAGEDVVTFDVVPVDDVRYDPDETVTVDLLDPTPPPDYTVLQNKSEATLTILDDEWGAYLPLILR